MSADGMLRVVLVALAVLNIGLTVYHWRLIRRGQRWHAEAVALQAEAHKVLDRARALVAENVAAGTNGHRPHGEPARVAEP